MGKQTKAARTLRLGFLPENDCAPLAVAHELGLFEQFDLKVELSREANCATLRDRIINGQLDAAHAPATLPFVLSLGLDFEQASCVSGLVLSLQGNAITISQKLWTEDVRDAAALRERIFLDWGRRTYTFGVQFPYSTQYFLLCKWLRSVGLVPHLHVRIVIIPPEQMFPTLELGYLDGFCAGEPWNSVVVAAGAGMLVTTSVQLAPLHPEKALLVREEFEAQRAEEHERLIAALREACAFCDRPENRDSLCQMLAASEYVNAPADCLRPGFIGPFASPDRRLQNLFGLNVFSHHHANEPSEQKAGWITEQLSDLLTPGPGKSHRLPALDLIFRRDLFRNSDRFLRKPGGAKRTKATHVTLWPLAEPVCVPAGS